MPFSKATLTMMKTYTTVDRKHNNFSTVVFLPSVYIVYKPGLLVA